MVTAADAHIVFRDVTVSYAGKTALGDISVEMPRHQIFGVIGPSGSGKTTLLNCINRMVDLVPDARHGAGLIDGGTPR
jgi:ABC-type phosphate transport system ATPase subunit